MIEVEDVREEKKTKLLLSVCFLFFLTRNASSASRGARCGLLERGEGAERPWSPPSDPSKRPLRSSSAIDGRMSFFDASVNFCSVLCISYLSPSSFREVVRSKGLRGRDLEEKQQALGEVERSARGAERVFLSFFTSASLSLEAERETEKKKWFLDSLHFSICLRSRKGGNHPTMRLLAAPTRLFRAPTPRRASLTCRRPQSDLRRVLVAPSRAFVPR